MILFLSYFQAIHITVKNEDIYIFFQFKEVDLHVQEKFISIFYLSITHL